MYIIASRNSADTLVDFVQNSKSNNLIDGIHIDIIMTRDEELVYYSVVGFSPSDITSAQNETFVELKESQFVKLEELLDNYQLINKKIVINVLNVYDLLGKTTYEIAERNKRYIEKLTDLLSKYPKNKFYVETNNNAMLSLLRKVKRNFKIGLVVSLDNLSFQEADFYSLRPNMINTDIILDLLDRRKEVMINFSNWQVSPSNIEKFKKSMILLQDDKYKEIYYVTEYPTEFYNFMNKF